MSGAGFHESLQRENVVKPGADRAFGFVFAAVFGIIGLWPLLGGGEVRLWSLVVAGLFVLAALAAPGVLRPLNRVWFRFGMLLHKIVNPVIMAGLFFLVVTPVALLMRIFGKRPLNLAFDRAASSYWIDREPPGPDPETMRNQF